MQEIAGRDNRVRLVFFLNVHVECVQMHLEVGTIYCFTKFNSVFGNVDEIGFKPVERFTGERNAVFSSEFANILQTFNTPFPLLLVPTASNEFTNSTIHRSDERIGTQFGNDFTATLEISFPVFSNRRIFVNWIPVSCHDIAPDGFQASILQ